MQAQKSTFSLPSSNSLSCHIHRKHSEQQLTEVLARSDIGKKEERNILPDVEQPRGSVQQAVPQLTVCNRVGEEVVVEKRVEYPWKAEEGHAKPPHVSLWSEVSDNGADGRNKVGDLRV